MDTPSHATPAVHTAPPRNPVGHSPLRRPGSVRRTSSIDMTWPQGRMGLIELRGVARDIFTPAEGGAPVQLARDTMVAHVNWERVIQSIEVEPKREGIEKLVGARGGGHLRQAIYDVLPRERIAGTPLYLLLDDISGSSLIAGWAWSRWTDSWKDFNISEDDIKRFRRNMEGVCIGFSPGSSALQMDGTSRNEQNFAAVVPLPHPDDPAGWHELTLHTGVSMRRARRIDVWLDDLIEIDATFQDSASAPEGGRIAIHEYRLSVRADPKTGHLVEIKADPRVLPYKECPNAVNNTARLLGTPMNELRSVVLEELRKTMGCTHLNDALRALAEVPVLIEKIGDRKLLHA